MVSEFAKNLTKDTFGTVGGYLGGFGAKFIFKGTKFFKINKFISKVGRYVSINNLDKITEKHNTLE